MTILNNEEYESIFVSPHENNNPFNNFIHYLGFNNIISKNKTLSDKEIYDKLYNTILDNYYKKRKFFIATYILGTHEGMDSPDIKYGDGKNSYLNKFYNQDYWFGKFFEKLKNSKILDDTLLVFTSDHAAYPSTPFIDTFKLRSKYFIDKIPLFIYNNKITPKFYDAKNKNSLSLAPTILNLIGSSNYKNYFLGSSLFINDDNKFSYISNIGFEYFDTSTGIVKKQSPNTSVKKMIEKFFLSFG